MTDKQEFKLIVAGGRTFDDAALLDREIRKVVAELPEHYTVSIVSGMAGGADQLAYEWARLNNVTVYPMPADWKLHNKRAGFIRNVDMAIESHGLLAFWDYTSKGTQHMIITAQNHQKEFIRVIPYGLSDEPTKTYTKGVLVKMQE